MKDSYKVWSIAVGILLAGNVALAAEGNGGTVDSQELFKEKFIQEQKSDNSEQAAKAVDDAVRNLPQLNSSIRWAAVKTPAELAEQEKAAQRQYKAVPIIITAADMDKARKAEKRGEKPVLIPARPLQPVVTTPRPQVQPPAVQPQAPQAVANTVELPPVQKVGGQSAPVSQPAVTAGTQETVELAPIQPVVPVKAMLQQEPLPSTLIDALVEATCVELNVQPVEDDSPRELTIQAVK